MLRMVVFLEVVGVLMITINGMEVMERIARPGRWMVTIKDEVKLAIIYSKLDESRI